MQKFLIFFLLLGTVGLCGQNLSQIGDQSFKLEVPGKVGIDQIQKSGYLNLPDSQLKLIKEYTDKLGNKHLRYTIDYQGFPVKGKHVTVHLYNQKNKTDFIIPRGVPNGQNGKNQKISVSSQEAIAIAKARFVANHYQKLAPSDSGTAKGLIYVPQDYKFEKPTWVLAYEIDVHAHDPWISKRLTIDASTGDIINIENRMCSFVPGTAETRYHGTRPVETTAIDGGFELRDQTRGTGIITRNLNDGNLFTDDDNNWNNANAEMDEVAGDVHWGSAATYDFYNDNFNWNGLDNNGRGIESLVHLDDANAFWDGTNTSFGDGIPGDDLDLPFTYINVIGHEMTHAVTEFSAGLIYSGESGGLNEAFSDIMGASIEHSTNPGVVDWLIGQETSSSGTYFRNMANPKEVENPDTYGGEFWDPGGDVHFSSALGNYWFYLLVEGGSGINDVDGNYDIQPIGWEAAWTIAHTTWTAYLTPSSSYLDCANSSIEAAENLYGSCSNEVTQVRNAWAAVNVLSSSSEAAIGANTRLICELLSAVNFNSLGDILNPMWDFGDGNQSTEADPTHIYSQNGLYTVTLSGINCNNEPVSVTEEGFILVDTLSPSCDSIIMENNMETTISSCNGVLVDDGGVDGDYANSVFSTLDISSPGAMGYQINLDAFSTESCCDEVNLFIDNGSGFEFFQRFAGNLDGVSLQVAATSIRFVWSSDASVTNPGFVISWNCLEPSLPVADFTVEDQTTCSGFVQVADASAGFPATWAWLVDGVLASNEENPLLELAEVGTYDLTLIACNDLGCDTITQMDFLVYDNTLPECFVIVMEDDLDIISTVCEGSLVDDGGPDENYSNNVNAILEVATPDATGYAITFESFNSEACCDQLQLLVDDGSGFVLFDTYLGDLPTNTISVAGARIRFEWSSDGSVTRDGFEISWTCLEPAPPLTDFSTENTESCSGIITMEDQTIGFPNAWTWLVNGLEVSSEQHPEITLAEPGSYDVELIACNDLGCDTATIADYLNYDPTLPACAVIELVDGLDEISTLCEGSIVDDGGVDGNYSNNTEATLEIAAPGAPGYQINFNFFNTENGFDELSILADNGSGFELVDFYSGNLEPFSLEVPGSRIQFIWDTDGSVNREGFEISWACLIPTTPEADFATDDLITCSGFVGMQDLSVGFPSSWSWLLDGTEVSTEQNPVIDLMTAGTHDIGLIVCNDIGCDTTTIEDYVNFDNTLPACSVIIFTDDLDDNSFLCEGTIVDDGGVAGPYSINVNANLEIAAPGAVAYLIDIISFNSESCCDELVLLVDNGAGFEIFETYRGELEPSTFTVLGTRIRFEWSSDGSVTRDGFVINWACLEPAIPAAAFTIDSETTCSGIIDLTDLSSGPPTSWNWLVGGNLVSSEQSPTITLTEQGSFDIGLIACNDLGCDTTTIEDYVVFDNTQPQCAVIVMTDELDEISTLCQGSLVDDGGLDGPYSVNVEATLEVASPGALGYQITIVSYDSEACCDDLALFVDNGNGFELFATYAGLTEPQTIDVVGTRLQFVWDTDGSVTRDGFEIFWTCIDENSPPTTDPSAMMNDCSNTFLMFANSANALNVTWDFGDGTMGAGFGVFHSYEVPGTYTVTGVAINSNGTTEFTLEIDAGFMNVAFEISDQLDLNQAETAIISTHTEDEIEVIQWFLDGVFITSNFNHDISFTENGVYELTVNITDINGCLSSHTETIVAGVVSTTSEELAQLVISPNPTRDQVSILNMDQLTSNISIRMMNTMGQLITELAPNAGARAVTIEMKDFPEGIYFLQITDEEQRQVTKKVVKVD